MTGLILGKFYPPHLGHKYLINTALAEVDDLTVVLCAKSDQDIDPQLRAKWLRDIHPGIRVLVIDQEAFDYTDAKEWARQTLLWLGGQKPDKIFSSEDYGQTLADLLKTTHVLVDKHRLTVPCTASDIRANPVAYLKYLEPQVAEYFKR